MLHSGDSSLEGVIKLLPQVSEMTPYVRDGIDSYARKNNFTPREEAVLLCIIRGCNYKETAGLLNVSENTIKTHVKNLLGKAEARNCAELMSKLFLYITAGDRHQESPRLLWIDDYPANNNQIIEGLSNNFKGIDLVITTDQALERMRHYNYDLIISDMGRGNETDAGMSMFDIFREQNPVLPKVIIFTSTRAASTFGSQVIEKGAYAVLDDSEVLLSTIQRLRLH